MTRTLRFCIPGDPATRTGGYLYDKHIAEGLRALDWQVTIEPLDASFPQPTRAAVDAAAARLADCADHEIVLIDGLALPGLAEALARERERLRLIGLIHHPVALETGLDPRTSAALAQAERRALARLHGLICTSRWTARTLAAGAAQRAPIRVVPPGTPRAARAMGSGSATPSLLSVATVTPRKGHDLLIDALARLRDVPWHLRCIGSLTRAPAHAAALRERIATLGLDERVTLHGEVSDEQRDQAYASADVFVLASRLEGYGMSVAEALVRGLPIVATRGGALSDLLTDRSARLVAVDDVEALAAALDDLIRNPARRSELATAAFEAGRNLCDWSAAARQFAAALEGLAQ